MGFLLVGAPLLALRLAGRALRQGRQREATAAVRGIFEALRGAK